VAEVGEADDRVAPHAQHVVEHALRLGQLLQGMGEDDGVERPIGVLREHLGDVALHGGEAALEAGLDAGGGDLDAEAADLALPSSSSSRSPSPQPRSRTLARRSTSAAIGS